MQELMIDRSTLPVVPRHLATEPGVSVAASSYPFATKTQFFVAQEGLSIAAIIEQLLQGPVDAVYAHVYINGTYITKNYWMSVYPKANATVTIKILPGKGKGKKNPLATILSIAVIAAGAWAGAAAFAALGGAAGGMTATLGGALASAAVNAVGGLLVNMLAPPGAQRLNNKTVDNARESPTLFIEGARNVPDPYGVVPVTLGKHRYVPKLGANTFTEAVGDQQYVTQLFVWGLGKYYMENDRIGETPLTSYADYQVEHFLNGEGKNAVSALYPNAIYQEELGVELTYAGSWQQRTTQTGCDKLTVDITLPQGLSQYNDKTGERGATTVTLEIAYSIAGAGSWTTLQTVTLTLATNVAVRRQYSFEMDGDQYDVRVRRLTPDASSDRIFNATYWTALKTVTFENPINIDGLSFSVLRMRATDQLNGTVDQYNADLTLIAPSYEYNSETWSEVPTRNPADLFRWVLQNSDLFEGVSIANAPNARPLADERMDIDNVIEFHDFCRIRGFQYGGVIDFETSVWDTISEICAAGRARPTLIDGKWGIVIDREQTVIVQHVTPANSWGLNVRKIFPEVPHALRIQFINEEVGFLPDEMLVFADGYDESNATKIAGLQLPGITKPSLIYMHGREHLASISLRPNEYTFNMDVEHLVVNRGGLIKFAHDVPLYGLGQGFITEVPVTIAQRRTDEGIIRVTDEGEVREADEEYEIAYIKLDRKVFMEQGKSYCVRVRNSRTGASTYAPLASGVGYTNVLTFVDPIDAAYDIRVDDMFMFGELGRETVDLIVRDITPGNDFTARIVCLDAAPGIFQASQGTIPPWQSLISVPASMLRPLPPEIVSIQSGANVQVVNADGSVSSRMVITLQNNNSFDVLPGVRIKLSDVTEYDPADVIQATADRIVLQNLVPGRRYDLQIYYKKLSGGISGSMYSPIVVRNLVLMEGVADIPPDVTNFRATVIGSSLQLAFDISPAVDIAYYQIRYSPNITGVSWYTATIIKAQLLTNETIVPAGTGTYLVKAFDRSGNESANAAVTSMVIVDERFNAVEIVDDHPTFPGTKTNTTVVSSRLELDDYTLEGIYESDQIVDLGDVFTARVVGHMVAAGKTAGNTLDSWPTLDLLGTLDGGTPSNWSAVQQVSLTEDDPSGSPTWGPWIPITNSMQTLRAAKSRVVLVGNGTNVTPSIEELRLIIDMEDRIEKMLNVTVLDTGLSVVYTEKFNATPTLVYALLDGQEGDVVEVTNESPEGFDFNVTNGGVGVTRHINYHVIGYGRVAI